MPSHRSIAAVRKDTQPREANDVHLQQKLERPEQTHSSPALAPPGSIHAHLAADAT